ncbi:uncharacterized protein GLRG_03369 [Colletotrichum graminicola M1.001]|uniref:Uncharacterized protein n=1 Tax=Colletotrichum graminicola (strain M1.001 / M2 / FGSC 10212) TaxID=645133 RepID=E3QBZ0_COLGM|nr:uncharacterized protein GLRG_03369 [Colletotrichum graminicola M1.001]EFQ28225.1 hypothetical protein GLRG_03369 [Colletotrichum graminicola M1.001]
MASDRAGSPQAKRAELASYHNNTSINQTTLFSLSTFDTPHLIALIVTMADPTTAQTPQEKKQDAIVAIDTPAAFDDLLSGNT